MKHYYISILDHNMYGTHCVQYSMYSVCGCCRCKKPVVDLAIVVVAIVVLGWGWGVKEERGRGNYTLLCCLIDLLNKTVHVLTGWKRVQKLELG